VSLRLWLLERHVPGPLRRRMFDRLVRLTADAFGVPAPDMRLDEGIDRFAAFTRNEAERALGTAVTSAAASVRLYDGARAMGEAIRRQLGIRRLDDALRALRLLYAAIGIELHCHAGHELRVTSCAFSGVYTPEVCEFVSSLDAGLVDGLTGGLTMSFVERITEGAPACRATLGARGPR